MGVQIGYRIAYRFDILVRMDLLDHPARMHLSELVGIQESVEYHMEMRRELPMVILEPPRMEDGDASSGPDVPQALLDGLAEAIVAFQRLNGPLAELLFRGYDPMPERPWVHTALLFEETVFGEPLLLALPFLVGSIVHTYLACKGPAMEVHAS